jgi:hypothetical protein
LSGQRLTINNLKWKWNIISSFPVFSTSNRQFLPDSCGHKTLNKLGMRHGHQQAIHESKHNASDFDLLQFSEANE